MARLGHGNCCSLLVLKFMRSAKALVPAIIVGTGLLAACFEEGDDAPEQGKDAKGVEVAPAPRVVAAKGTSTCSSQCPANAAPLASPADAPGCAATYGENSGATPTKDIVACLTNLACALGRNPTKVEALAALGVNSPKSMLGASVQCSAASESGQPIPDPLSLPDGGELERAMRCISVPFVPAGAWCSFTTLPDDGTIECVNLINGPGDCGTDPVGIDVNHLCQQIDETKEVDAAPDGGAAASVYDGLLKEATEGQGCYTCHDPTAAKARNGKSCYLFPINGGVAKCPLKGATGIFLEKLKTIAADFSELCSLMRDIKTNAARASDAGIKEPDAGDAGERQWRNTSFVDAYLAQFCAPRDAGADASVDAAFDAAPSAVDAATTPPIGTIIVPAPTPPVGTTQDAGPKLPPVASSDAGTKPL